MPKPLRVGKRVIWDRLKVEAAFADLDEEGRDNFFDCALKSAPGRLIEAGLKRRPKA